MEKKDSCASVNNGYMEISSPVPLGPLGPRPGSITGCGYDSRLSYEALKLGCDK